MSEATLQQEIKIDKAPSIFGLLADYRGSIILLIILGIVANGLALAIPKLVAAAIDTYATTASYSSSFIVTFSLVAAGITLFIYLQSIVQTYVSERVARDMRLRLVETISTQNFSFIADRNPAKILTNITSDVDAIKMFVAQAIVSLVSSVVIIFGASILLLLIDWKLALAVLTIVPAIGVTFYIIFSRVRVLFLKSRTVIDGLNKVINESIVGAALIRVLDSTSAEANKFAVLNNESRTIGIGILSLFSLLVPIIAFLSSIGVLIVVVLGGYFVTTSAMTIGSFVAFMSYIAILIFPILVLGFISTIIAQATASYERIYEVLKSLPAIDTGTITTALTGNISLTNISLSYDKHEVLKHISCTLTAGSKTAIIGPTGSGKTQLLNILTGLITPQEGTVLYDGIAISNYTKTAFYSKIGIVFQDSVLFNASLRENIAFSNAVDDETLATAIKVAELTDFIATLPQGLDTIVSERGSSLSGGQKQRIMLARALASEPTILFLDDFTARVDAVTEQKILKNIEETYPQLTLISITQKIAPIEDYDQIILIVDGEMLATGTHAELLRDSIDYQLIYNSQRSTQTYEVRT